MDLGGFQNCGMISMIGYNIVSLMIRLIVSIASFLSHLEVYTVLVVKSLPKPVLVIGSMVTKLCPSILVV